jgi:hypothetical protein
MNQGQINPRKGDAWTRELSIGSASNSTNPKTNQMRSSGFFGSEPPSAHGGQRGATRRKWPKHEDLRPLAVTTGEQIHELGGLPEKEAAKII